MSEDQEITFKTDAEKFVAREIFALHPGRTSMLEKGCGVRFHEASETRAAFVETAVGGKQKLSRVFSLLSGLIEKQETFNKNVLGWAIREAGTPASNP
jgi:hypothetical protein